MQLHRKNFHRFKKYIRFETCILRNIMLSNIIISSSKCYFLNKSICFTIITENRLFIWWMINKNDCCLHLFLKCSLSFSEQYCHITSDCFPLKNYHCWNFAWVFFVCSQFLLDAWNLYWRLLMNSLFNLTIISENIYIL